MWTGFLLMKCECGSPPCDCKSFQRDSICEHQYTVMKDDYPSKEKCNQSGTLREDCNTFWQSKKVLCEDHYGEHYNYVHKICGVCGTNYRNCTC